MWHPDMLSIEEIKDMMGLQKGDVFRNSDFDEVLRVEDFTDEGDAVVYDPEEDDTKNVSIIELFEDWSRNIVYPVSEEALDAE